MIKKLSLCILLLNPVLFANDSTQKGKVRSCSALYVDKDVKTASDVLLEKGCMFGIAAGSLVCAVVGTVLSAGVAGPVAIPGGIAACAAAAGTSVFQGIKLKDPVKSFCNDQRMFEILLQARKLVSNTKTEDLSELTDFYNKKFSDSTNTSRVAEVPSLHEVALTLIKQDNAQTLCTVTKLGPCEGTFMTFLSEDEIFTSSEK